ncbi:MAG: carbohydrate-binding domain-containing protein [Lachnospiraceae bacterium]|nr:carbohydrate-binding domain-containing protein [Lachnospiraceae bacterium]
MKRMAMKQKLTMFFLMTALAVLLTGCGGSATAGTSRESASDSGSKAENQTVDNGTDTSDPVDTKQDSKKNDDDDSGEGENVLFTKRDLEQSPDLTGAKTLTVKDGETLSINAEGTYVITGTAKNCTIKVDADKKAKIQLVLQDVTVTNTDFPVIYVVSADKCFVTLQGSNSLSVTGSFRSDGETNTDAVIYSREDLTFNGTGTLTLTSSENGISGKDDVKFTGGTYVITSDLDAIEANDSVAVYDGTFTIVTKKDGIHSENDDDNTVGWIVIAGGTMNIQAKSDCLQATTYVRIDDGNLKLNGSEGIEGTYIEINDGTIDIYGSDDGINASRKSKSYATPTVVINGGDLKIEVGRGDTDAIDANGDIIVNGGTIDITSTVSSFDYDGKAEFNGGTIIINGTQVDSIPKSMMGPGGGWGGPGGQDGQNNPGGHGPGGRGSRQ